MPGDKRTRKRQTQLAFSPLPSSSPAAKGYHKQIQERAAAVTIASPFNSAKRRKLASDSSHINSGIPTPIASRQTLQQDNQEAAGTASDSESEPIVTTQRGARASHTKSKRRQQRLDFSNVRDSSSFSPLKKLSSPSRPQSPAPTGMFGARKKRTVVNSAEDSDEELPSPEKFIARRKVKGSKGGSKRITRSSQPIVQESKSESEDDVIVVSSARKALSSESEDDNDDMPTTTGMQARKRTRRGSRDSFISSSPPAMVIDSDDDLEIIEQPKKKRPRNSSGSENEPTTPRRLKPRRQMTLQEKEDLEDDLDFLGPSSDVDTPRGKRDTETVKKNARQNALERLKRRRSKQIENVVEDDSNDDFEENDDDSDDQEQPPRIKSSQMFREDEHDHGFIETDDEEESPVGVPDGIPLEFTRYATMKAKELFKHAVEWFVQKKINPGFSMNDPIYVLTFRKLDDEVTGLAASKFKSAAWTIPFTTSLNARPHIAYEPLDRTSDEHWMRDSCDACNRTGHPATYQVQFQGKPYHRETLEDVAGNEDEDEDDDSDSDSENANEPSYDAYGREVAAQSTIYYVGKFCMGNAQVAHSLQHWRYHLNEWVVQWLDDNEYNDPREVVKRDRLSTKKRNKYANKIVDKLERAGVIKELWRDYRKNIDEARESTQGRNWGRD